MDLKGIHQRHIYQPWRQQIKHYRYCIWYNDSVFESMGHCLENSCEKNFAVDKLVIGIHSSVSVSSHVLISCIRNQIL